MFALVMLSARSKTAVATLIWAVAAGATANIFMAWYGKPELIWMAIAAYAWLLVVLRKDVKIAVLCLLLFYALAPVSLPNPFASAYVQDNFAGGSFLFPNTLTTITEISPYFPSRHSGQRHRFCGNGIGMPDWPWIVGHPPSGDSIRLWPAGGVRPAELRAWQPGCFLFSAHPVVRGCLSFDKHRTFCDAGCPVDNGRKHRAIGCHANRRRCKRHAGADHRMGECTDRLSATPQLSKTGAGRADQA